VNVPTVFVCWKWPGATSAADRAALEVALRLPPPVHVAVATVGPVAAEPALREALACGAASAVRLDAPPHLTSATVARALASACRGARWVVCGDASSDRGSGSVPAFLAAELDTGQALGLTSVAPLADGRVRVVRRLDGGRREVLDADPGTVLSVEGGCAELRRASLPAELAATIAPIDVRPGPTNPVEPLRETRPYRPRARAARRPSGDAAARIRELTGATESGAGHRPELVALDPPAAAAHILARLGEWGYLGEPGP
jgi:electron transfer flavoprotein beta subunit